MSRLVLDSRIGWAMQRLADTTAEAALRLASHPVRPRVLADPAGMLGGLTAPVWAVAAGPLALFLLDRGGTRILLYDPCLECFALLGCLDGRLDGARALALDARGRLLVADTGNRRIQVVDPVLGRVLRSIGPVRRGADGMPHPARSSPVLDPATGLPTGAYAWPAGTWEPMALATLPDSGALIADRANAALWHMDAHGRLAPFADGPAPDGTRIAAPVALQRDREGRIYIVQEGQDALRVLAPDGGFLEDIALPEPLAPRFDPPAVSVDADGTIWISPRIPGPVLRICRDAAGRCDPAMPVHQVPPQCTLLAFDHDGAAILGDARQPCLSRAAERAFAATGFAISAPLDSRLGGCLWDRVMLTAAVPAGTRLMVETFTAEAPWSPTEIEVLPEERWRRAEFTAPDRDGTWDAAVLSPPGRYLWLRLTLSGDGALSPEVTRIEANWPRETSRRHLPPAMAPDPESADFLDRFLLVFDRVRAGYTRKLDDLAGLFDSMATPAAEPGEFGPDFLDWLADWIGLALERNWPVAARRRLVREAARLYRLRGTPLGLRRHVAIYTGSEPRLIEHFRMRQWLALGSGRLDAGTRLWGPEVMARLQLDAFAQIGQFVLTDTGDPLTDPFGATAHRATLLVPVEEPGDARLQATVERIAALAAPAHVLLEVRLLAAGFRLGCEAVLGAATRLPRRPAPARLDAAVLGGAPLAGVPGFRLGSRGGARLGAETRLNG
ncbi:phage tail protein [Siccirubricoccus sp. G192]|uniref:phage tail protein n=1 Tax=Siccirubricoccus sp. G192 TaxID=2849651 RepID=UPI001C2BB49D|nr:phage tail protein [Siccirubricoccus sp. G192]MBV1796829.1 hypothetical protein [Siccirubricoccus sp. G192]